MYTVTREQLENLNRVWLIKDYNPVGYKLVIVEDVQIGDWVLFKGSFMVVIE